VGSCEYGDEPSGSGATELVNRELLQLDMKDDYKYAYTFFIKI
jgi:hypothetical protein